MAELLHNSGPIELQEQPTWATAFQAWAWGSGDVLFSVRGPHSEFTMSLPSHAARRFSEELLKAAGAADAAVESAAEAAAP